MSGIVQVRNSTRKSVEVLSARFYAVWAKHRVWLVILAIIIMAVVAILRFSEQFSDALLRPPPEGAVDLYIYYTWTHDWFHGINFYAFPQPQGYPPASLVILYPLTGWLDWAETRWLYTFAELICLAALVLLALRATKAVEWRERTVVCLLILSNSGAASTFGNGQPIYFTVFFLAIAILILHHAPPSLTRDICAAVCFVIGSIKPNLSAPFFWLLLVYPNTLRLRPVILTALGYIALTVFALQFVPTPPLEVLQQVFQNSAAYAGLSPRDANLNFLLARFGLVSLALPAMLVIWLGLGIWSWRARHADVWLLMGVAALVARMWSYHRGYDNLLLFFVEIALWRMMTRDASPAHRTAVGLLLALNVLVLLVSVSSSADVLHKAHRLAQGAVWLLSLLFLVTETERTRRPRANVLETLTPTGKNFELGQT